MTYRCCPNAPLNIAGPRLSRCRCIVTQIMRRRYHGNHPRARLSVYFQPSKRTGSARVTMVNMAARRDRSNNPRNRTKRLDHATKHHPLRNFVPRFISSRASASFVLAFHENDSRFCYVYAVCSNQRLVFSICLDFFGDLKAV